MQVFISDFIEFNSADASLPPSLSFKTYGNDEHYSISSLLEENSSDSVFRHASAVEATRHAGLRLTSKAKKMKRDKRKKDSSTSKLVR